jgi:spermidine/putrescine-binding protein
MSTGGRANNHNQTSQNKKKGILVADDESDVTLTLKLTLEGTGLFDVDTFNDSELALKFQARIICVVTP